MPITRSTASSTPSGTVMEKAVANGPKKSKEVTNGGKNTNSESGSGAARTRPSQPPRHQTEGNPSARRTRDGQDLAGNAPRQQPGQMKWNPTNVIPKVQLPTRVLRNRIVGINPSTSSSHDSVTSGKQTNGAAKKAPNVRLATISQAALQTSLFPFPLLVRHIDASTSTNQVAPKNATGKGRGTRDTKQEDSPQAEPSASSGNTPIAMHTRSHARALELKDAPKK